MKKWAIREPGATLNVLLSTTWGDNDPGCASSQFYWGLSADGNSQPIVFDTAVEAWRLVSALRWLSNELPHRATIRGLRSGDDWPKIVEVEL